MLNRIALLLPLLSLLGGHDDAFAQGGEPARRALLIGIDRYASDAITNLQGAVNDVRLMEQILSTRFGFRKEDIRLLLDEKASREGIKRELARFVRSCGKDDIVYIHYSGHGSQVKDLDGDEAKDDGLDETLVPHDGRTPGVADITDDEIAAELSILQAKTPNVVVVIDACHSGTATRSVAWRTRRIEADTRTELYPQNSATRAIVEFGEGYSLFTGAAANQQALDGPCGDRCHGLFTYAFAQSLERADPATTIRQIMADGVTAELRKLQASLMIGSMPEPQLETSKSRLDRPLFFVPCSASASRAFVRARREKDSGELRLEAAVSLGAAPGSVWGVYPAGATEFGRRALARATVRAIDGNDAIATLEPSKALLVGEVRAVLITAAAARQSLTVRFGKAPADRQAELRAVLGRLAPSVTFVDGDSSSYMIEWDNGTWIVRGATGEGVVLSVPAADAEGAARRLGPVITRSHASAELLSLENPTSSIRLTATPVSSQSNVPTYRENGTRGIAVKPSLGTASYRVRRNDEPIGPENSMMIEVRVDRTCYLTIVDVDSVGGVTLLYPNEWSEEKGYYPDGRIPGGQNVRFPDKNARNNRSGFLWEVQPPAGPSTIRVFASTDRETAVMMRDYVKQAEDSMKRFRSTGNVSEGIAPLRELRKVLFRGVLVVDSAAQPSGTRPEVGQNEGATGQGGGTDVPDWTATTVNYRVVE